MAAVRRAGNLDFGNANKNTRQIENQTYQAPTMTDLDPFAKRKKGKFVKNRAARIKLMKEKRMEEAMYEQERARNTNVQNNKKNKVIMGLYVFHTDPLNDKELSAFTAGMKEGGVSTKIGDTTYTLVEIIGRGPRFQKMFTYTAEYEFSFNKTKYEFPSASTIEYKMKVRGPDGLENFGLISLNYKSKKVILRGGYMDCTSENDYKGFASQPQNLLKSFYKIHSNVNDVPKLKRTNTVASYRTGRKFDYKKFIKNKPALGGSNVELNIKNKGPTRVFMKLPGNHVMSVTNNGVVQVAFKNEVSKPDVKSTFNKVDRVLKAMNAYFGGAVAAPVIKSKAITRANAQPAPNVARRGTTCPKGKRPEPYSFSGKCPKGMYVRPNPQQQPCCYKIPKQMGYYRGKIRGVYNAAGVRMPNSVSKLFGLNKNSPVKNTNIPNAVIKNAITTTQARVRQSNGTMKTVNTIKIGSRQCIRYTKQQILNFILRIGYAETGLEKKSKEELCAILARLVRNKNVNKTNNKYVPKAGDKLLTLRGSGQLAIGGRQCLSYSKPQLQKFCKTLGINYGGMTRDQMCAAMKTKHKTMQNKLNTNKDNARNRAIAAAQKRTNVQKTNLQKKRDDRLYSEFLGSIQGFLKKYDAVDSKNTVPSRNKFLANFNTSVNQGYARNITDVSKRGWKAGFKRWLDEYIVQYKSAYEPMFINKKAKKAAAKVEELRKKRENAAAKKEKITLSLNEAKNDLVRNLRPVIDPKLRTAFNAKLNVFAREYKNFVEKSNSGNLSSRKRAFLNYEKGMNDSSVRKYLESVVANLKPHRINENRIQRYELNRNFKLVKGAIREVL